VARKPTFSKNGSVANADKIEILAHHLNIGKIKAKVISKIESFYYYLL